MMDRLRACFVAPVKCNYHRHCLADNLKQRGVDGNIIGEILGHSSGSITLARYGKAYIPKVLLEALKKLEYGIDEELRKLPHWR